MKVMTRTKAKANTRPAKGRAATIREWIDDSGSTLKDTRKQARRSVEEARKEARRQVTRARIAAARARAEGRAKASGVSRKAVGAAGAAALVAGYFLDPDSGRQRRHAARDRVLSLVKRGADRTPREADHLTNDQTLADRVKSEIFQPADAPKGSVNVNVENGIVYLRGEVKRPDQIRKLIDDAGAVDGVRGVENLLHASS